MKNQNMLGYIKGQNALSCYFSFKGPFDSCVMKLYTRHFSAFGLLSVANGDY